MKPNDVDEKSLQLSELIFFRFAFDENLLAQRIEVCWRMLETIQTFSSKAFIFTTSKLSLMIILNFNIVERLQAFAKHFSIIYILYPWLRH